MNIGSTSWSKARPSVTLFNNLGQTKSSCTLNFRQASVGATEAEAFVSTPPASPTSFQGKGEGFSHQILATA